MEYYEDTYIVVLIKDLERFEGYISVCINTDIYILTDNIHIYSCIYIYIHVYVNTHTHTHT
jgi:hypothetical protein